MAESEHMEQRRTVELYESPTGLWARLRRCSAQLRTWQLWKALLLGQLVSGLICATAITSNLLANIGVHTPTAQSFLTYVLLCMIYTTILACRPGDKGLIPILRQRGWMYFLVGIVDVEANYLVVKAYHYTTLTSVQLLDCFTIPVVLALSCIFLHVRYKIVHIVGTGICLLGVGALVWADVEEGHGDNGGSNKLLGDMLCLAGATLYGISNVFEEYIVKNFNRIEFLGMLGLFGSVVNGIQLAVLERHEVAQVRWDRWDIVILLIGFSLALFILYSIISFVMSITSATAVNLYILSTDFYSLIMGIFVFNYHFNGLYFISFTFVIFGIIVYSIKPTPVARRSEDYTAMTNDHPVADVELTSHSPSNLCEASYCREDGNLPQGSGEPYHPHHHNQLHDTKLTVDT